MNRNITSALVITLAAAAGQALADDITIDPVAFHGSRPRAEVAAELVQYRASQVNPWASSFNQLAAFRGKRTRGEVQREYVASRNAVNALTGEDSGAFYLAHQVAGGDVVRENLASEAQVRNAQ